MFCYFSEGNLREECRGGFQTQVYGEGWYTVPRRMGVRWFTRPLVVLPRNSRHSSLLNLPEHVEGVFDNWFQLLHHIHPTVLIR